MGFFRQASKLAHLLSDWPWETGRRKTLTAFNPKDSDQPRVEVAEPVYTIFDYNAEHFEEHQKEDEAACKTFRNNGRITWINVDGLKKDEVEKLCRHYEIHPLLIEDILSVGQRAKLDETGDVIFTLLPMLYYNEGTGAVETEQVSIVLGKDFVISFQEDKDRDVFDPVREKLRNNNIKLRSSPADYLSYALIDVIVDSYFPIIEKINDRIERLEDALLHQKEKAALAKISLLRREIMLMLRSISPVKDVVGGIIRSENDLLEARVEKYYKDVYDHISQAIDYVENHREMLLNLQDLSMSQINVKMNEVMKTFTMVATLLAPATVIGGIFGMNFDVIPLMHQARGFYWAVGVMLVIPLFMLVYFKRKGWF